MQRLAETIRASRVLAFGQNKNNRTGEWEQSNVPLSILCYPDLTDAEIGRGCKNITIKKSIK